MNPQDVLEAFDLLPDWEDRFEFVAELGSGLPTMPGEQKTDANLVKGCNTRAWLTAHLSGDTPPRLVYEADAETPLVRGLVALLLVPFRDKTPAEVLATDAAAFFGPLGLEKHLSANRRAGMEAFIGRVMALAREHATHP